MTYTEQMTVAEAQAAFLALERAGTPPTLERMLRHIKTHPECLDFTRWFGAHMAIAGWTLEQVAEDAALDLETLDEDSDILAIAARLREAVRREREKTR